MKVRNSSLLVSIQCRSSMTSTRGRRCAPRSDNARNAAKRYRRRTVRSTRLVMVSFTYMRSEADLTLYVPTQRVAIVVWTKLCVLDDAASADDRRPRLLGGSGGSGCAAGRQSG